MDSEDFSTMRYASLVDLWMHHNSAQEQELQIVFGAVMIVLAILAEKNLVSAFDVSTWGKDATVAISTGIPLIATGIGVLLMHYLMRRARRIMDRLEDEIVRIERSRGLDGQDFRQIHKGRGSVSGMKLVRGYLLFAFGWPMVALGLLSACGLVLGAICLALAAVLWVVLLLVEHTRAGKATPPRPRADIAVVSH